MKAESVHLDDEGFDELFRDLLTTSDDSNQHDNSVHAVVIRNGDRAVSITSGGEPLTVTPGDITEMPEEIAR